ncbi:hypothetical protein EOD39_8884 [Acipenser ruthenus]|uniref:Uncharacterized protein n=1 Tax=Acipenser ruthenus TaxID=7906 RepID=A0A662YVM6_ACIRT|nr:hypothetical protein EOD39_8884 [Acipenser ruthenus]
MGRRRKQQQQVQQRGAGRKSHRVSAVLDDRLTCLRGEEWCFAVGTDIEEAGGVQLAIREPRVVGVSLSHLSPEKALPVRPEDLGI